MRKQHIEVYNSGKRFRWRLVGANGEIMSQGEPYTRRYDAVKGALRACGTNVVLII
jgi:uncharacterized protein YegP (UPF0339 family)